MHACVHMSAYVREYMHAFICMCVHMNACVRICAVQPFLCGNTPRSSSVQNSVYSYFAVDLRLN